MKVGFIEPSASFTDILYDTESKTKHYHRGKLFPCMQVSVCFFNVKRPIIQLYHGENGLLLMICSCLL